MQLGGFQHAHFPYAQTYQQRGEKLIRVLCHRQKCLQIAFFVNCANLHLNET